MNTFISNQSGPRASLGAVCKGHEKKIATKTEVEELRALAQRVESLTAQLDPLTPEVARAARLAKEDDYRKDPTAEKLAALHPHEWEIEKADNEKQRVLIKGAIREAGARAETIAADILTRAQPFIEEATGELTGQEEQTAARYEVPFAASPTLEALRRLGGKVEQVLANRHLDACAGFIRWLI